MRSPIFGFDIDDVVFYTFKELARTAKELMGVDLIEPSSFGSGCTTNGLLSDEDWRIVVDAALIDYDKFDPIPGALNFLERYQKLTGNPLVFITSRNPERKSEIGVATEALLRKHIPNLEYYINYSKSGQQPKVEIAKKFAVDVFIEDRLKYAKEVCGSGICVLMPLRTWNKRYLQEDSVRNLIPINDWNDVNYIFDMLRLQAAS